LFQRASADLSMLRTVSGQQDVGRYLEALVAKAYVELHGQRERGKKPGFWKWFSKDWPRVFRAHAGAFWMAILITAIGSAFGAYVINSERDLLNHVMPGMFSHLMEDPSERVATEEKMWETGTDHLSGQKSMFAGQLMLNNIKVAVFALALGIAFGVPTVIVLFYNGVILGMVVFDYVRAGETEFLLGWLLPHGVPELTAIFIGGQAGLVLARAMIGWGSDEAMRARLRAVRGDLVVLISGGALMLVWAGFVEAFFSQYHYPVISYSTKISVGVVELVTLVVFFGFCGRESAEERDERALDEGGGA
ncbi:MAG: stage II sporulation protein M, partial [Verrucomicrobiales bacterium]|nr:stage II sporulation protein M [Verrucomicrobiales bacterium]